MYEYISGTISELTPTYVVIDSNGIGYLIYISLNTSQELDTDEKTRLFISPVIREDSFKLFGFFSKKEREVFNALTEVSKIGPNTALTVLSSYKASEIQNIIKQEDITTLKAIKGIGAKTAQRMVIDLKDKVTATEEDPVIQNSKEKDTFKDEALSALTTLGFSKSAVNKEINKILSSEPDIDIEMLIKKAMKNL